MIPGSDPDYSLQAYFPSVTQGYNNIGTLDADPETGNQGDFYYSTSTARIRVFNGSNWVDWSVLTDAVKPSYYNIFTVPQTFTPGGTGYGIKVNTGTSGAGFIVQANASGSYNLTNWNDSGGTTRSYVTNVCGLVLSPASGTPLTVSGADTSAVSLIIKGAVGNSGDLQQWQTSSQTVGKVDSAGAHTYSPSAGVALTVNGVASTVGLIVKLGSSGTSDLQQWQNNAGTVLSSINASGALLTPYVRDASSSGPYLSLLNSRSTMQMSGPAHFFQISAAGSGGTDTQTGNLIQYINNAWTTVYGGRNAVGQLWSGSTAPVTVATGGATTAASGTGTVATITTTNAHGLAVGDLVTVAGVTPTGYNATAVVTAVTTNTFSYANTTTGAQTVAGTVAVPAQASITPRSAGTVGLLIKGAASQAARALQIQTSSGSEQAYITAGGIIAGGGNTIQMSAENSGGELYMKKQTAAASNPGAGNAFLYFRDGTNANTLKLVVRAGAAGAETTILDNIPT